MCMNTENCLNMGFTMMLLTRIISAFNHKKLAVFQSEVGRFGVHDDFIYSEFLADNFDDLHQDERYAVMHIIRAVINHSAIAYYKILDDGYYCYEDYGIAKNDNEMEEFLSKLDKVLD